MMSSNIVKSFLGFAGGILVATLAVLLIPVDSIKPIIFLRDWIVWVPLYFPRWADSSDHMMVYQYWALMGLILAGLATWSKRFFIVALVLVLVIHTVVAIGMYNYKTLGM